MAKLKLNNEVTIFLYAQKHPLKKEIEQLRLLILSTEKSITENIKWNGPNYCFANDVRITMRIQPPTQLQLIFHRGAKVKEQPKHKIIKENSGILSWRGNDRAIATFKNMPDIEKNKSDLVKIVTLWIYATK